MSDIHLLSLSPDTNYPYQLVHSKKAKYVRIKLSNNGDLSVVLPRGLSPKFAHEFIKNKSSWVEKNLGKLPNYEYQQRTPEALDLKLLGEYWVVDYIQTTDAKISLVELPRSVLRISGNYNNTELLYKTFNHWCKKKARKTFTLMLEELAELHGFHYQGLSIRAQKTRWGSCSSKKNINLNCKLLFMPEEVVTYVMIHELCHTLEMNHSKRFWALVEDCDPDYKNNRKMLKCLGKEIVI